MIFKGTEIGGTGIHVLSHPNNDNYCFAGMSYTSRGTPSPEKSLSL